MSQQFAESNPGLARAALRGKMGEVKHLLQQGADPNTMKDGQPLLLTCVSSAPEPDSGLIEVLVEGGAIVDVAGADGVTPLMKSSSMGYFHTARALLSKGADANRKDSLGETALIKAASAGAAQIVKLLLQYSADPAAESEGGVTALSAAQFKGHAKVASMLKVNPVEDEKGNS